MMKKVFSLVCALFAITSLFPVYVHAEGEIISDFVVNIDIQKDASILVEERILYDFGSVDHHGIIRNIPLVYGEGPEKTTMNIEIVSVTDDADIPYTYTTTTGTYKEIKIGDANTTVSGKHWYVINYRMHNIINGFENHDELYFNVTGNYWDVPILHAVANVTIPEMSQLNVTCFTGAIGSQDESCTSEIVSTDIAKFETTSVLIPNEGLTIVLGFNKGIVTVPSSLILTANISFVEAHVVNDNNDQTVMVPQVVRLSSGTYTVYVDTLRFVSPRYRVDIQEGVKSELHMVVEKTFLGKCIDTYIPIGLFILLNALFFWLWYTFGKEPEGRGTIIAEYDPPDDLSPGEIGVIVDQKAHMHDISASIVHLAINGYLTIKRTETKKLLGKKISFSFVKNKEADDTMTKFERTLFDAIFSTSSKEVSVSSLKNTFYVHLDPIKKDLYQSVIDKGYFKKNPENSRILYLVLSLITLSALFIAGVWLTILTWSWLYVLLLPFSAVSFVILSFFMGKYTEKGKFTQEKILGLKLFMTKTVKDRLAMMQSPEEFQELFEKLLPYAVALDVEEKWAKQFKDLFDRPMKWMTGNYTNSVILMHELNLLNATMLQSMFSKPSDGYTSKGYSGWSGGSSSWSGGSGFSGGYSGGGFGGGGGSSW